MNDGFDLLVDGFDGFDSWIQCDVCFPQGLLPTNRMQIFCLVAKKVIKGPSTLVQSPSLSDVIVRHS